MPLFAVTIVRPYAMIESSRLPFDLISITCSPLESPDGQVDANRFRDDHD
jgi:hypothetical protein